MSSPGVDWRPLVDALADELTANGKLVSPRWQTAFRSTPRHVFVPEYREQDSTGEWRRIAVDGPEAVAAVYRNVALFTDVDARGHGISSSSMPGLMTRMLELLDLRPGHRVLEIGTGTGYNTALLCAALGDANVFSVDIDYTTAARDRLGSLGHRPTVVTGDGRDGLAEHAPFDRVLATVAVPRVPPSWSGQLAEGGLVLADLKITASAGNLVLLRKAGDGLEGRFDTGQAYFMRMRHTDAPVAPPDPGGLGVAETRTTHRDAAVWLDPVPWFLSCLEFAGQVTVGYRLGADPGDGPRAATLTGDDGSWAEVDMVPPRGEPRTVTYTGPLWPAVERGYTLWETTGRPGWNRLGVTVTATRQTVWLDAPTSPRVWCIHPSGSRRQSTSD